MKTHKEQVIEKRNNKQAPAVSMGNTRLNDVMKKASSGTVFYVGSHSAFFFIGTRKEYFRYRKYIEKGLKISHSKSKAVKTDDYTPIEKRSVLATYRRFSDKGLAVILEGDESGAFWFREEFRKTYRNYDSRLPGPPIYP